MSRSVHSIALAALLFLWGGFDVALARSTPTSNVQVILKPSYGGAVLVGKVTVPKGDELVGVWSSFGRARLLKCNPRCETVKGIPTEGLLVVSEATGYRVVFGGKFKAGQKLSVVMRFRQGLILNLVAQVSP